MTPSHPPLACVDAELPGAFRDALRSFAEEVLPGIVHPMRDEVLTFERLLQAQFLVADRLSMQGDAALVGVRTMVGVLWRAVRQATARTGAQPGAEKRFDPRGYCVVRPGLMTPDDYALMQAGTLTVGELRDRRPIAFLAPVVRLSERAVP